MSESNTMRCFRCDEIIESIFEDIQQPYAGTSFYSHGQYGSTVFDNPNDGSYLEIYICDACLIKHQRKVNEWIPSQQTPPTKQQWEAPYSTVEEWEKLH